MNQNSSALLASPPNDRTQHRISTWVRADYFCVVALCLLSLLSWLPKAFGPIDIRWDGGTYYVLGTSLAEGRGYRLLNEPGEIKADQYPPLLPILVAVHEKVLGTHDVVEVGVWLRRTWILISISYVISTFLFGRLFLGRVYAFWLSLVCLMSYDMYYLSTLLFAELPFALATTLFVYSYHRQDGKSWTRHLAPVFAIAAYLLRSLGVALLAAWVADALFRRQFRQAALRSALAAFPVLAWQGYVHRVETGINYQQPSYAYQRDSSMFYNVSYAVNMKLKDPFDPDQGNCSLGDYVSRFAHNALSIPSTLGQSVTAREGFYRGNVRSINHSLGKQIVPQWPYEIFLNFLGGLVLIGIVRLLLARQWTIALTMILTLGAVCTTPWPGQFARYIAPILPLLLLSLLTTLRGVTKLIPDHNLRPVGKGLLRLRFVVSMLVLVECSLALQSGFRNFLNEATYKDSNGQSRPYRLLHYTGDYAAAENALRWLVPQADSNAVLAASMPQWIYLQSGLKSVMPPLTRQSHQAQAMIDTVPVSFYIAEQLLMDDNFLVSFPALVKSRPDLWKPVYGGAKDQVRVYARLGVARLSGSLVSK